MSIPTPEQFLTQPSTDEDDEQEPTLFAQPTIDGGTITISPESVIFGRAVPARPSTTALESMAASLSVISSALAAQASAGQADAEAERRYLDLDQAYADLEDKHQALYGLLADVEKIVAPSTSKLANAVREAITRWRNPEVPVEEETGAAPEPDGVPAAVQCSACSRYFVEQDLLDRHECTAVTLTVPAYDADVEIWREYARTIGVLPDEPDAIDSMNRSQIRTMLGLPQVEGVPA